MFEWISVIMIVDYTKEKKHKEKRLRFDVNIFRFF